jgi:hypothetical protein
MACSSFEVIQFFILQNKSTNVKKIWGKVTKNLHINPRDPVMLQKYSLLAPLNYPQKSLEDLCSSA